MNYGGMKGGTEVNPDNAGAYKSFTAACARLTKIMSHKDDFRMAFGPKGVEVITEAVTLVKAQSEEAFRGRESPPSTEERNLVQRTLDVLQDTLLLKPMTPFIRDISIEIARMTSNWDRALCKCPPIRRKCLVVDELARAHLSLVTAIEVMGQLLARSRKHLEFTPPAFEVSRHYLDLEPDGE